MNITKQYTNYADIRMGNHTFTHALHLIDDNTSILDVGCADGVMGQFIKQHRTAEVFGFEYDLLSVQNAQQNGAYTEVHQVDLEQLSVCDYPEYKNKFNHILCCDILEHLRNPMQVLNKLNEFIKKDGSFIASLPNLAHSSIKASLLVDDFTYTDLGILDNTHLKHFTYKNLAQDLANNNYKISKASFVVCNSIQGTQPTNPFLELPFEIIYYILSDIQSHVFQYVVKFEKSNENYDELLKNNLFQLKVDPNNPPLKLKMHMKTVNESLERMISNINK